jgi:hypothetical protein
MQPSETIAVKPVLLAAEFCALFGVSLSTMRAEMAAGRLRAFKIGAKLAVAGEDAFAWRDAHRDAAVYRGALPGRHHPAEAAGEPVPA